MFRRLAYSILAFVIAASAGHADPIITGAMPNTFTPGSVISSSQVNANFAYVVSQVNANAAKNGANSSITSLSALSTPITTAAGGTNIYVGGASTGTANAQVIASAIPNSFTLTYGNTIRFIAGYTNTGATTLAVNGLAATDIWRQTPAGPQALAGGEIVLNQLIEAFYDGTRFELITNPAQFGGFGAVVALANSATPDLGTIATHNILLNGGPFTITSFGSSASTVYPLYLVRFNAFNTLTQSANLNLLNAANRVTGLGDQGLYLYNGTGIWYEIAYWPQLVKAGPSIANVLYIRNNVGTPNTQIDVTATEVVMDNGSGGSYYVDNYGTCTINFGVVGAGGIDVGAIALNSWYHIYAISSGSGTSCLASLSSNAPTMPAGYTFKMRLGATPTTAGAILYRWQQRGNKARFVAAAGASPVTPHVTLASGTAGTCSATSTWAAVALFVPTTAVAVDLVLRSVGGSGTAVQPSSSSPDYQNALVEDSLVSTSQSLNMYTTLLLESFNVYWCSNSGGSTLFETGWTDTVNAN